MERLLILTLRRKLQKYTYEMIEKSDRIKLKWVYENAAKRILKTFCEDNDLNLKYTGGDNYIIKFA